MAGSEHELKKKPKLTEEMVTEVTLSELEKNPEGITKYPILEFDERALRLLSAGVAETLQYSHVKPAGGRAYCAVNRFLHWCSSLFLWAWWHWLFLRRTAAIRFFLRSV